MIPDRFSATEMVNFKDPDLIPEMLNAVAVLKENGKEQKQQKNSSHLKII